MIDLKLCSILFLLGAIIGLLVRIILSLREIAERIER